jgi:uncharacterized protein (DUF983 family)
MTPRPRFWRLLWRTFRRRCPVCGQGPLFRTYFTPHDRCSACGFYYVRGNEYGREGYFTGAMAINLVITGVVPLVALFILAVTTRLSVWELTAAGVAWTVLFPIVFYPYSCALWIVIDHLLHPPTPAELAGQRPDNDVASPLAAMRGRRRGSS